jgi:outer membrane immunogenic protein
LGGAPTNNTNGFTGGAEIGYNYQINNFVVGLEGDFQYQDLNQSRKTAQIPFITDTISFNEKIKSEWLSTVRSRLGYATGNFLGFVTGGLAIADYNFNSGYTVHEDPSTYNAQAASSQTLTGWTVGAGAEYALAEKWSIKAEYLYADFQHIGSVRSLLSGGGIEALGYTEVHSAANLTQHIARLGINYRF